MHFAGRHLKFLAGLLIAGAAAGVAYRYLLDPVDQRTLPNFTRSALHGVGLAFSGWAMHLSFAAVPGSRLGAALQRLPLAVEFALKALAMTSALTVVAVALQIALYFAPLPQHWLSDQLLGIVAIAFAVSLVVGAIFEFQRLIGGRVLGSFLLGTYRRPKRERRVVMFLDIADSTALAESMGELRVHDLITRFFFDIDGAICGHDGEVHAYVGDAVIVTWPFGDDAERNARAIRCFFAAEDRIASLAASYDRAFGVAPRFRAGIHAGPVVISECGSTKRQIAYFGDTMNVAARLCDHCKQVPQSLVVSADLLRAAAIPPGLRVMPGESVALRGRHAPVEAHAIGHESAIEDPAARRETKALLDAG